MRSVLYGGFLMALAWSAYGQTYTITPEADIAGHHYANPVGSQNHMHQVGRLTLLECDLNGDGIKDLVTSGSRGTTFVVFGDKGNNAANWNLAGGSSWAEKDAADMPDLYLQTVWAGGVPRDLWDNYLDGHNGYMILGVNPGAMACGDINNDGKDDLLLGDHQRRTMAPPPNENYQVTGAVFVILGTAEFRRDKFYVSELKGWNGFVIEGFVEGGRFGSSISAGGDVNGDGVGDIVISTKDSNVDRPQVFVLYGKPLSKNPVYDLISCCHVDRRGTGGTATLPLYGSRYAMYDSFHATIENFPLITYKEPNRFGDWYMQGYIVMGAPPKEWYWKSSSALGYSVSATDDINNDGKADIVIGSPASSGNWDTEQPESMSGTVQVIMGKTSTILDCTYTEELTMNPPYSITSMSSIWSNNPVGNRHGLSHLNSRQAWSARWNRPGEYIQFNIGTLYSDEKVLGVVTQGRADAWNRQYVDQFVIQTSVDGDTWTTIECTGADCVTCDTARVAQLDASVGSPTSCFPSKHRDDGDTTNLFTFPAGANLLRITVVNWQSHISMRAGLVIKKCKSEEDALFLSGIGKPLYAAGPKVSNAEYTTSCSGNTYYPTLELAQAACDEDPACAWLHDWQCDGINWRTCGVVSQMNIGTADACTRLKKSTDATGFRITGDTAFGNLGAHVDTSGDINGDGIKDLVMGSPGASYSVELIENSITRARTEYNAGKIHVLYGSATLGSSNTHMNITDVVLPAGMSIHGVEKNAMVGKVFTSNADLNSDGKADILIGTPHASFDKPQSSQGGAHIYYGRDTYTALTDSMISVADLTGSNGYTISGFDTFDMAGTSVSAGDFSGDGAPEIAIGVPSHWLATRPAATGEVSKKIGTALVLDLNSGLSPVPAKTKPLPGPDSNSMLNFCECPDNADNDLHAICMSLEVQGHVTTAQFETMWPTVGRAIGRALVDGIAWTTDSTEIVIPPYSQYSMSSIWSNNPVGVSHGLAKLDSRQAWSARYNRVGEWMQIDLGSLYGSGKVRGVVTQGRQDAWRRQYVTSFKVQYATVLNPTDSDFTTIQCSGADCLYQSGYWQTYTYNYFTVPDGTTSVRLVVQAWQSHISWRAALLMTTRYDDYTMLHQTVTGPLPDKTLYVHVTALVHGLENATNARTRFERAQFQGDSAVEVVVKEATELNMVVIGQGGVQACSALPPSPKIQVGSIPSGFAITGIEFDWRCMSTGCWVIDIIYTRGHPDAVNTFYLPRAEGGKAGSYDEDTQNTYFPKNFPCGSDGYDPSNPTWKYTGCCLPEFLDKYRPVGEFEDFLFSPDYNQLCNASDKSEGPLSGDVFNVPVAATFGGFDGLNLTVFEDSPMIAPGVFAAKLRIDEWELKNMAGMIDSSSSILRTKVETFVGMANFVPTQYKFLDSAASQIRLSLVKGDFFTVGTSGDVQQTFVDYMYMRLHEIKEDEDNWLHYVAVTFTLASNYEVNDVTQVLPLTSIRVGKGSTAEDATWTQACTANAKDAIYDDATLRTSFADALTKDCAPAPRFCQNQASIADNFISFQIPLGKNYFSTTTDYDAGSKIFVEFVVSVVDKTTNLQASTTMTAEMPIMPGGTSLWCESFEATAELVEIATVDLVIGSAGTAAEMSRLAVIENMNTAALGDGLGLAEYSAASMESGLMTLVLKGDPSIFDRDGFANYGIEMEHLVTVHVMESNGLLATNVQTLIESGEAFVPKVDEIAQRAYLEPTEALLELCTFTPETPTLSNPIPSPCILRRDAEFSKCPESVGAPCAAMEINPDDTASAQVFMQDLLGSSDYAATLGANFSNLLSSTYSLNGRYNRAWWVNPGMIWNPILASNNKFQLSQQVMVAAMVKLKGSYSPGSTANQRRMLLSSGLRANTPQDVKPGEIGGNVRFTQEGGSQMRTVELMSEIWGVPMSTISTWRLEVKLTEAQACKDNTELRTMLQEELTELWQEANPSTNRLFVNTATVTLNGVSCGARRSKKQASGQKIQLRETVSDLSAARAQVEIAISLPEGANTVGICQIKAADNIVLVEKLHGSEDLTVDNKGCEDSDGDSSSGGFTLFGLGATETIVVLAAVGAVAICGCLICIVCVMRARGGKGSIWPGRKDDRVRNYHGGREYDPRYGDMIEVQSNSSEEGSRNMGSMNGRLR